MTNSSAKATNQWHQSNQSTTSFNSRVVVLPIIPSIFSHKQHPPDHVIDKTLKSSKNSQQSHLVKPGSTRTTKLALRESDLSVKSIRKDVIRQVDIAELQNGQQEAMKSLKQKQEQHMDAMFLQQQQQHEAWKAMFLQQQQEALVSHFKMIMSKFLQNESHTSTSSPKNVTATSVPKSQLALEGNQQHSEVVPAAVVIPLDSSYVAAGINNSSSNTRDLVEQSLEQNANNMSQGKSQPEQQSKMANRCSAVVSKVRKTILLTTDCISRSGSYSSCWPFDPGEYHRNHLHNNGEW